MMCFTSRSRSVIASRTRLQPGEGASGTHRVSANALTRVLCIRRIRLPAEWAGLKLEELQRLCRLPAARCSAGADGRAKGQAGYR